MSYSLFPYDKVRDIQSDFLKEVYEAVESSTNRIVHAPTGLGKTAASLAAAIASTIKTNKTIFFLTPMHTQHKIALETIKEINEKHDVKIVSVDIIGKRHMCLQPGVNVLNTKDFSEYCKALREDNKCNFYSNLKNGDELSFNSKAAVNELKNVSPISTQEAVDIAQKYEVCPYEISLFLGKESKVIITDYYYIFHPRIRDNFLAKIGKQLQDAVIIVDEAHNLPSRIKDLASEKLSNIVLKRAILEAEKYEKEKVINILNKLLKILETYDNKMDVDEVYMRKETFLEDFSELGNYEKIVEMLEDISDEIREEQKYSYIGSVVLFLKAWLNKDEGFTRIFSRHQGLKDEILMLSYKCLDPGIISRSVFAIASSTILMSGTLTPTSMYADILGFDSHTTKEVTLKSPFPEKNRLNIIVPRTSTKFTARNEEQYEEIARIVVNIVNTVPGNSAVFFPSYKLRDDVYKFMNNCEKTVFTEKPGLSKQEKEQLLDNYKSYKNTGAVLLGITSGSFGEGIDLPGDFLKCVVVVGLPLSRPDLETKALIDYYDKKFKKGWDYGYVYPAFNKTLQSAGRCIRSGTDRGVIVFLDERYAWPRYKSCFPETWDVKVTLLYDSLIKNFFGVKEPKKEKTLGDF